MASLPLRHRTRRHQSSADDLRFELGARSAIDHLAPAAIEASRSHLVIDGRYVRVLGLSDYPRYVHPNWLARLIDFDEPLDALQRGEERVFSVSLYVCLGAGSASGVDDLHRRVETALGGMMASSRAALFEMLPGFLSCLPAGRDYLGRYRNLDTTSAATMIPFTSSHLSMQAGILYGISVHNNSLVIFDPFSRELENANKVVFAKSGAGKSYACKVEALRALMRGVEYYIIDPEDEYARICEAVGGQYIRLSGSSAHHINPFDLAQGVERDGESRDALTERLLALQGLLGLMLADRGSSLGQRERGALDRALLDAYGRAGITREPTHGKPPPVLRDLYDVLREGEDARPGRPPRTLRRRQPRQRLLVADLGRLRPALRRLQHP
jgi:hypothetical protein